METQILPPLPPLLSTEPAAPKTLFVTAPTPTLLPPPPLKVRAQPATEDDGLPEIDDADALLTDRTLETPPEIIQGVLHKGTKGVIASASKAGKTWLLLDLAMSISTGTDFLGWKTTKGKVLFINFEIPKAFMKKRLGDLKRKKGLDKLENLHVWTLRGYATAFEDLIKKIVKRIEDTDYCLIILDPIYKGMVGRDENTAGAVGDLVNTIEQLAVKSGAAVIYAHHFSKGGQANKNMMDRLSGSGVFARDADTIITLTPHDVENCNTVELILRNFPSQAPFVVESDFPVMVVREDLDPAKLKGKGGRPDGEYQELLIEMLDEKPMTSTDWKKAGIAELGISTATFNRELNKIKKAKLIAYVSEGSKKWQRVPEVTSQTIA